MEIDKLERMCDFISTWDQREIDGLLGQRAIDYAVEQERQVRLVAAEMWQAFPLGPRWWMIRSALKQCRRKAAAIKARANEIARQRKAGRIVVRGGRLVDTGY